jgi:hypothetical protein
MACASFAISRLTVMACFVCRAFQTLRRLVLPITAKLMACYIELVGLTGLLADRHLGQMFRSCHLPRLSPLAVIAAHRLTSGTPKNDFVRNDAIRLLKSAEPERVKILITNLESWACVSIAAIVARRMCAVIAGKYLCRNTEN